MPRKKYALAEQAAPRPASAATWSAADAASARILPSRLVLDTGERWDESRRMPWQQAAHEAVLGIAEAGPGPAKVWIDGPTGAGKDQIIAAAVLCFLHFAPKGLRAVMLAQDHDRSRDVVETLQGFIRRDRDEPAGMLWRREQGLPCAWIGTGIEFLKSKIVNEDRDVSVECVATDGASASGVRADLFILNEVQSWADPHGYRVWTETLARYKKKSLGRFAVLSNLPFTAKGDWRRDAWENARAAGADGGWTYIPVRLPDCPWITPEYVAEQRRDLPPLVFRRLFECEPTDGRGELIEPEHWTRCEVAGLAAAAGPVAAGNRVTGVDLGVSNDHATILTLRHDPGGAVVLEALDVIVPPQGGEINLQSVEDRLLELGLKWGSTLYLDPWQAVHMRQRLEAKGVKCVQVDSTEKALTEMAVASRELFTSGRVRVWPNAGRVEVKPGKFTDLRQQLLDAELKEKARGLRIVSKRTALGHGDQASAFALAACGVSRLGVFAETAVGTPAPSTDEDGRARLRHLHGGRFTGSRPGDRRRNRCV